jgi:hypothetical protein
VNIIIKRRILALVLLLFIGNLSAIGYSSDLSAESQHLNTHSSVSDPIQLSDGTAMSYFPALSHNGSGWALAWVDKTSGTVEAWLGHISSDGEEISGEERLSYTDCENCGVFYPTPVWDGSEYGVSWCSGPEAYPKNRDIVFSKVSSGGGLIDSSVIVDGPQYSSVPVTLWTGSEFGMFWIDNRENPDTSYYEYYFSRVSADGEKIGDEIKVTQGLFLSENINRKQVIWTGSEFHVFWQSENTDLFIAKIQADGTKAGDIEVGLPDAARRDISAVWTGSGYGLTWWDRSAYPDECCGKSEVYFARVDIDGQVIGEVNNVSVSQARSDQPTLAWTGSDFGIAWREGQDIMLTRFSGLGTRLDYDITVASGYMPFLAWSGEDFGLTYVSLWEVYFQSISF